MLMSNILFNCFLMILLMLKMLLSLAYLTLFERKILSYMQSRKGPNKVGVLGVLQPFSDALKLLLKEFFIIESISYYYYLLMPMLMIILSFMMWFIYPYYVNWISMDMGLLLLLSLLGINVYPVMLMGWSSSSNYSMLGSIRSIAQSISYEVSLFLIFFILIIMIEDFNMISFIKFQFMVSFIIFMYPIYLIFFLSMMIELNRTPFDLVEGESELVSGFNTEYYGSLFTMIFMSEYLMIVFVSFLISLMFFGFNLMNFMFNLFMVIHMFMIIWIRSVLPRMRYDDLMNLCWKKVLTLALMFILFYMGVKEIIIEYML